MLSKRELKEKFQELSSDLQIRTEKNQKKFYVSYLEKAFHNLEVSGSLVPEYFDWIIITSYYAMYMAATSAIAKLGLKATTHGATVIALEYMYCVNKNLLPRKYINMIEKANFSREDIHKLDEAMKRRLVVQYTITNDYGKKESKQIFKDAKDFVNKIGDIITE